MKKIVVIASLAESLVNFRFQLLQAFCEQGIEVIAYAPNQSEPVTQKLATIGVTFKKISLHSTKMNVLQDIKSFWQLKKILRVDRPDIVLSYTIKPVIYGSLAAKRVGVRHTYSMITGLGYAFMGTSFKSKLLQCGVKILYRHALKYNERVFFQNPDDAELFVKQALVSNNQIKLINGSGVDLTYFNPVPLPTNITFLLIARLLKDKGLYEYIAAATIIRKRYPAVKFILVGAADPNPASVSEAEIEEWAKTVVDYRGFLQDVRPAIQDASIYVLPSYREGTPRSVLEAMAMGRPIITTDAPGCRETVIEGKNGFLVPVKNVEQLIEAMERFILNPSLIPIMGEQSHQLAVEKYDVRKVNQQILQAMSLY
jgi:glycosyltransferase involved in cell wall biosynthesis